MAVALCPAEQLAFDELLRVLSLGNVVALGGETGMGKTTVLQEAHRAVGGAFLTMKDYIDALRRQHPAAMEETFEEMVMRALTDEDCVLVDDLHLLSQLLCCHPWYP